MPTQEAYRTVTREFDTERTQMNRKLRRVLGEWDGLASLKDEIRIVEAQIRQGEDECTAMIADCVEPTMLHLKEAQIGFLQGYLKGLRYTLDRRAESASHM
jgi:hypothetical protein